MPGTVLSTSLELFHLVLAAVYIDVNMIDLEETAMLELSTVTNFHLMF